MESVSLTIEDVKWAVSTARSSIEKWSTREGYYNNRTASHLNGKLGELAVEKYLLDAGCKIDSHFRFPERENLSDIVVKVKKYTQVCRLEVKTWSANYWPELGRCIAVDQYPVLKKKADRILWCVIDSTSAEELLKTPTALQVSLAGWSSIGDVSEAPIQNTGIGEMRKVNNYQLSQSALHPIEELLKDLIHI